MPSLRDIFESIDLEWVTSAVRDSVNESLHLDFKTLGNAGVAREDKSALSKAISAFLNSDGGLIVYGIDCRKNTDGVDAAQSLQPIQGLSKALSRIQSLLSEVVSPIHEGITAKAIAEVADAGFIAIYVPASDSAPHMARGGDGRYYKRSGSNSVPMEHFDLEDMFGRRPRPRLALDVEVARGSRHGGGGYGPRFDIDVMFSIANDGRGVARYPLLAIAIDNPYSLCRYGLDGNKHNGLPERTCGSRSTRERIFAGGVDDIIHGSTSFQVCKVSHELMEQSNQASALGFHYKIGADGIRVFEGHGLVEEDCILSVLRSGKAISIRFP